ncbi:flagellar protein FlaG [Photobacterium profundum]|uniref:flagellar protein FlaG n=1 Tax=Photobacterium profundum TaxID=74109 RepID=UPI003D112B9E
MDVKPIASSSPSVQLSNSGTKFASSSADSQGLPPISDKLNQSHIQQSSDKGQTDIRRVEQTASVEKQNEMQRQQLEKVVERLEEFVGTLNKGLAFRIDEESGRSIVTIYDKSSGEIVRQIPDEDILTLSRQIASHSGGLVTTQV